MTSRNLGLIALAVVGVAAAALLARAPPRPPAAPKEDPFAFVLPTPTPRGEPVKPPVALKAGDEFRGKGTFSYRHEATGNFGSAPRVPALAVEGTFTSTRRVGADAAGARTVTVEARLEATERRDGGELKAVVAPLTFAFQDGVPGPMSVKGARLEVADEMREGVEPLVEVFAAKPPLPDRPVRLGDSFEPKEALDLEAMRRQTWYPFRFTGQGVAAVEGTVWVEDRVERPSGPALQVRTLLRQEQEGLTSLPKEAKVTTRYETVVRGRYRVGTADGAPRDVEWENARRLHVVGKDFDYVVHLSLEATLVEERVPAK